MTFELLDDVAKLLAAASRAEDAGARAVYLAEARVRVDAAKARARMLDQLTAAAEAEMVRLARGATK